MSSFKESTAQTCRQRLPFLKHDGLAGFGTNEKLTYGVNNWLDTVAVAPFFDVRLQKLVPLNDMCLNSGGEHIKSNAVMYVYYVGKKISFLYF